MEACFPVDKLNGAVTQWLDQKNATKREILSLVGQLNHSQLQRVEQVLQNELEQVYNWLAVNRFKLSVAKSLCMLIGSRQRIGGKSLSLSVNGDVLQQVLSIKYLGLYIDQHLTWQNHIDYVLKRVRGKNYSINRLNPSSSVKKLLYQAYLLPVLDYCDAVWAPTNANQTKRLERLHSMYTYSSISKYSLSKRRKFHTTVQVYKILHRIVPGYLYNIFEYAINVTCKQKCLSFVRSTS